jgi:hypothetical protein
MVTRIYTIKNMNPLIIRDQLGAIYRNQVQASALDDKLVVRTWIQLMPAVEQMIRELDQPSEVKKNIEFTVYLIHADMDNEGTGRIPDKLVSAIDQLQLTFAYKGYSIIETLFFRVREGRSYQGDGILPFESSEGINWSRPPGYELRIDHVSTVSIQQKNQIVIDGFHFEYDGIVSMGTTEGDTVTRTNRVNLQTSLDIADGQLAIVGKTSADGTPNALILFLTARIID